MHAPSMPPPGVVGVWADEPFELIPTPGLTEPLSDPVVYVASHMANVHNTFIRTLNTIYLQAPYITTPDLAADFFQYCRSLGSLLYLHHSQEEAVLFPKWEKLSGQKGLMEINVHQHEVFQPKLAEFNTYVEKTKPGDYSAERMKELIDDFAPALMTHLADEIPTIMALREYGNDVKRAHDEFETEVRRIVDSARVGPITFLNTDRTYEGGRHPYPVVPGFVPYVVKYIVSLKYKGAWKFGCCDYFGQPRTLWYHGVEKAQAGKSKK